MAKSTDTYGEPVVYDYSVFVVEHIRPLYEKAMSESVKRLADKFPLFAFDPMTEGVKHWTPWQRRLLQTLRQSR